MVGDITEREALDRIAALCDEADRHRQLGSLSTLLIDVRAVLALVRPASGGVTLTPEEADLAAAALRAESSDGRFDALAARLEAAS